MALAFLVPAGVNLRGEFDLVNPHRDRASDGWIGDVRHQHSVSDHNPLPDGAVLAIDVDVDGVPMGRIVAFVVDRCRRGIETRLQYVIYNRVIWSASWGWKARAYHGIDPHTGHAHFSFKHTGGGRLGGPWGVADKFGPHAGTVTSPRPRPSKQPGRAAGAVPGSRTLRPADPPMSGLDVLFVQRYIGPKRCGAPDGVYGPRTVSGVKWYQDMRGIDVDGIVGPATWRQFGRRWTGGRQ